MPTPIHPAVQERIEHLRDQFRSAEPFRHVVIDSFLDPEYCRQLISEFPAFDEQHALNEFGDVGGKAVFQNLRGLGAAYKRFDGMIRSRDFRSFVSEVTGIPRLLYDPEYVGGGTHENLQGQDLDPHVDFNYHPTTNLHRRLNLILFLNSEWREEWGGSLELHRNPWLPATENKIKTILPLENRCVLFETSEHSWHGFGKIQLPENRRHLSRRSIAVYFYTRERPAQETAAHHSTVYVQRPLPAHIQPGYTLRDEDVERIRTLVERRDRQIQFLYERELRFSTTLASIAQSPTFRLFQLLVSPLRKLRDWGRARKSEPDGDRPQHKDPLVISRKTTPAE